jgi:DNA primase
MNIPQDKVAEILERTDIVQLVSRYVQLKKSGRDFVACCPFHNEKTPSFHVTPGKNVFYCFGCHAGGDAIAFVRKHQGKTFVEAVEELARDAGIEIARYDDPAAKERTALREVNELAARFFAERLRDPARGRPGREHLEKRGVPEQTARAFGLGYSVAEWNDFSAACAKEGVTEPAIRAGLIAPSKKGDGYYDVFRGRLMVPIRSADGRVIAFGGRHVQSMPGDLREGGPKYLNSKESRIYVKSEVLFGLDLAKESIRLRKSAVLVEGYFDCIGLHRTGVTHVVALCSTALTAQHMKLLDRMDAKELVLLFDGDAAGLKGVERLAPAILATGTSARVVVLPEGQDPDDYALARGGAAVEELIEKAPHLTDHLLSRALPKGRASGWEEKVAAVRSLRPVIEAMPAGIEKTMFIGKVADHVGVPESEVRAHMAPVTPAKPRPGIAAPPQPVAKPPVQKPRRHDPVEEMLCALVVVDPTLAAHPEAEVLDRISHLGLRSIAAAGSAAVDVLAVSPQEVRERVERRLSEVRATLPEPEARRAAFEAAARDLKLATLDERIALLKSEMAEHEDLTEDVVPLHEELRELTQERLRLKGRGEASATRNQDLRQ